jgi:hypothetical protein
MGEVGCGDLIGLVDTYFFGASSSLVYSSFDSTIYIDHQNYLLFANRLHHDDGNCLSDSFIEGHNRGSMQCAQSGLLDLLQVNESTNNGYHSELFYASEWNA